ncbi:MAG: response regulator transcription factor [Polyangiaceae bacterium]
MANILLIDDDRALLEVLCLAFEDAGHQVLTAPDGAEALRRIGEGAIELVVSDVNMPLLDGFSLCRKLRAQGNTLPLILLTSRDNDIDEALGLDVGADDYVSKPFSTRVLLARVTALLRRTEQRQKQERASAASLRVGPLELFPERVEARFANSAFELTLTEFRVLECLAKRPGVVFSRERLLELIRGDTVVDPRIVDTYVRRLRRKLEQIEPSCDLIETVIGAGYRLREGK